jgi:hypothetical protein
LSFSLEAQEKILILCKIKRMSVDDLLKKKEGKFSQESLIFSSGYGFWFCVRSNIYWNGERANPLFPYTPYLAKLKVNAAYYTSEELVMSLDIPITKALGGGLKLILKHNKIQLIYILDLLNLL